MKLNGKLHFVCEKTCRCFVVSEFPRSTVGKVISGMLKFVGNDTHNKINKAADYAFVCGLHIFTKLAQPYLELWPKIVNRLFSVLFAIINLSDITTMAGPGVHIC